MSNLLARFSARLPTMMRNLGLEFVSIDTERVVARLAVTPELGNANGVLHGGAIMAFADHIGATGAVVNLPEGANTATIESKTSFFGPGKIGDVVTAEAIPLHRGKRTMVWQTTIKGSDGRVLAMVTQTQIVMRRGGGGSGDGWMP